jgi:transketolase
MNLDKNTLSSAATIARGLAIDAVHASKSGHLGLPLGCAEIGAVLFGQSLRHAPEHPDWPDRDRFVLSAGHGSMFLYAWLCISGYADFELDEVKQFRQLHAKTPGHPERETVPNGVETTTGPLGQGVGNAVGMALSEKMAAARFNTSEHQVFSHKVVCLAGDGCLQEGVAREAIAFAGHQKLDNFILIYDSNAVTLDADASATQSEDVTKEFEALGYDVQTIDGHDLGAIATAVERAKSATSSKPQLIVARTIIGKGIPEVQGTSKGHGEGGANFAEGARKAMGLPAAPYFVSPEVKQYFDQRKTALNDPYEKWVELFRAWQQKNPQLAQQLAGAPAFAGLLPSNEKAPEALFQLIAPVDPKTNVATRKAAGDVLQPIAAAFPLLISGSADLYGSNLNYIGDLKKADDDFTVARRTGRNIRFGIREHGMCAILNGLAGYGVFRPSGGTFLVFADYCRASIRLAALTHFSPIYVFTHDSVGVGEDGPTHQPVETIAGLRVIPNLDVIRPADPEETVGAWVAAMTRTNGPTLLALSRQNVPTLNEVPVETRRQGVLMGAYVAKRETAALDTILLASGSELQHAMKAAEQLGPGTRVVSMPSFFRFNQQPAEYRESVLPRACRKRVSIEAGVTSTWAPYVGLDGISLGIDQFGISAPGGTVMKELGMTAEHVVNAAKSLK